MKIGIYPGSFNPFHKGHENIYLKSKELFDKIFIVQAINSEKWSIEDFNKKEKLTIFNNHLGFTSEGILFNAYNKICRLSNCDYNSITCIRGIRNSKDYEYQSEQDYWLKSINNNFKSIYIECDEEYKHLSSTVIRQLKQLNQETKHLIS